MRRWFALVSVALAVSLCGLSLAGCQPQSEPPAPTPSEESEPDEEDPSAPAEPAEAEFVVDSLEVSSTEVVEGESVVANVSVTNVSEVDGTYSAKLTVNGTQEAQEDIDIPAGASGQTAFELAGLSMGRYTVEVDGQTASFAVVGEGLLGQTQFTAQVLDATEHVV